MIPYLKNRIKKLLEFVKSRYYTIINLKRTRISKNRQISKLNLGSGETYLEGYLNVDLDATKKVDVLLDFCEVPKIIDNNSLEEIIMIHSISYLSEWKARDLLSKLNDILRKDGQLIMEFPDSYKCASALLNTSSNLRRIEYLEAIRGFYAFGMEDYHNNSDYFPYKFGWSKEYLIQTLLELGYTKAWYEEPITHGARSWRDSRVIAIK